VHFHFALDTVATPEQVLAAFTDFTERRTQIWEGSLDPAQYEVHQLGDTWAVVKEGSARPLVWAIERYDWSEPGTVKWAAQESNFCGPGSGLELTITANAGGGSHIEGEWHRTPQGFKGDLIVAMARVFGPKMIPKQWAAALDRYAATEAES
jgi:hypothetical protein